MDWKKWIATNVRGTPMSLTWLPKCFPLPVANYGVTKWGADGKPTSGTKQMTFANLDVAADRASATVTISWQYGMTVPSPETPKPVAIDPGSISFPMTDVYTIRKMETKVQGVDPTSGEVVVKDVEVYAFYVREATELLVIEVVDMKENLEGDTIKIEIAKS
jgi:hypothetical protein